MSFIHVFFYIHFVKARERKKSNTKHKRNENKYHVNNMNINSTFLYTLI